MASSELLLRSKSGNKSDEIFEFVMKTGNGVKGLVAKGVETVPPQCIQPIEERIDRIEHVSGEESVPIIDVSDWDDDDAAVAEAIREAASSWGFFQVINHGIPQKVLDTVMEAAHVFFELPPEEKMKYLPENSPSNSVVFYHSAIGGNDGDKVLEWRDSITHECIPGDDGKFWPPQTRNQILEFQKYAKPVAKRLIEVLLKGLGVKALDQTLEPLLMGKLNVSMNYYPPCPSNPNLTIGCRRHCDISSITMVLQDDTGGLYVRGKNGNKWVHIEPVKGALAVNIGDSFQIMSNGRYKSVEHCAAIDSCKTRVSIPFFVNPSFESVIGPLPEVLETAKEKPVYKQVRFSYYWDYFMNTRPSGKASIDFARI